MVTVLCKHCDNNVAWEYFPVALLSLDGRVLGSWGLCISVVCQSLKENNGHHGLSCGCSALKDISLWRLWLVKACRRHNVLPRKGHSHHHPSSGMRKHWVRFLGAEPQEHSPVRLPYRCLEPVQIGEYPGCCYPSKVLTAHASLEPRLPHHALQRGTAPYSSCLSS